MTYHPYYVTVPELYDSFEFTSYNDAANKARALGGFAVLKREPVFMEDESEPSCWREVWTGTGVVIEYFPA